MARGKLTDAVKERILTLAPSQSSRDIAATLETEGISVDHTTIFRFLKSEYTSRSAHTRAMAQATLQEHVLTDLQIMQATRDQLDCWRRNIHEDGKTPLEPPIGIGGRLLVIDRLRAVVADRLRAGGVTDDDKTVRVVFAPAEDEPECPTS